MAKKSQKSQSKQHQVPIKEALANPMVALSCNLSDQLKRIVDEKLPESADLVTADDFVKVVGSCSRLLQEVHSGPSTVALDRHIGRRVVLSLIALDAPPETIQGLPDSQDAIDELSRKKVEAAKFLADLNLQAQKEHFSYEQYMKAIEPLPFSEQARGLLGVARLNSPIIQTPTGQINLKTCIATFKDLPSESHHQFNAEVTSVVDLPDKSIQVLLTIRTRIDGDVHLIKVDRKCIANRVARKFRASLLAAQISEAPVTVKCLIPRVPLKNLQDGTLDIDIQEFALNEKSHAVARVLSEQMGLDFGLPPAQTSD